MTELRQVYKCFVCGNIVEVLHEGAGELVCCGEPMKLFTENTVDAATEKHVPVIEAADNGILVRVGDVAHPMEEDHYIEWIEVIANGQQFREKLHPGEKPEACFPVDMEAVEEARELCNLHGIWKETV